MTSFSVRFIGCAVSEDYSTRLIFFPLTFSEMPLLQTRATMIAGEDTATFPLWGPEDGSRYEARLVNFNARVHDAKLEVTVKAVRRAENDTANLFGFTLMRIYGGKPAATKSKPDPAEEPSIDVTTLASRFHNRFRELRANRFSVVGEEAIPNIEYDRREKKFLVHLPRRSTLSTEDPFLFGTILGLDLTSLPQGVVAKDSGNTVTNESLIGVVIKGRERASESALRDVLPSTAREFPAQSVVHAGLLEDAVTFTRKVERAHPAAIARALQETTDDCLEALSIGRGMLKLTADESDATEIEVSSKVSAPETNVVKLTFEFSVSAVRAGSNGSGKGKDEILKAPREVILDPSKGCLGILSMEEDSDDPLQDRYPLSLLCQNYGSADSFIVGRGPQSVLALIKEPGHVIRTSRSEEFLKSRHLVLSLVDKYLEPVRPTRPIDIFLSFFLKPVIVAQGK